MVQILWTESTETLGPCWETVGRTAHAELPHLRSPHWDLCFELLLLGLLPVPAAGQENLSPPCSPDLTLERSFRDLKENKEPSPKVKRRRSVKISSVTLEPTQWQSDALQIITSTNDYRSMNDFLMKKVMQQRNSDEERRRCVGGDGKSSVLSVLQISDLDTEDSKKDTMVDVVFKKALKEFRLNIFNSYSTALTVRKLLLVVHLFDFQ